MFTFHWLVLQASENHYKVENKQQNKTVSYKVQKKCFESTQQKGTLQNTAIKPI